MENAAVNFREITDVGLCFCDREALVEAPIGDGIAAVRRKWVRFFRKSRARTYRVNVAQITHVRRFSVPTGRIEIRKNPFLQRQFRLFVPKTAEFFVDEGKLDLIEVRTSDGTTFCADASASEWLKEIAPSEAEDEQAAR